MTLTISNEPLDALLKCCRRPDDRLGEAGLIKELRIRLMERMLGAELTAPPGYEAGAEAAWKQSNHCNGILIKRVKGSDGEVPLAVPRDRDGSFEPELVKKGQTRTDGVMTAVCHGRRHRSKAHGGRALRRRSVGARHPGPS